MMKRLFAFILVVSMMIAISACGDKKTTVKEETSNQSKVMKEADEKDDKISSEEEVATEENQENGESMRPEFKEAMDSYEAFYDKYCDFMKKYKANPTNVELIAEYPELLAELVDMDEAFKEWEGNNLNNEELKYYIEVSGRIAQKLVDVAEYQTITE